jgi:hypothetical protein
MAWAEELEQVSGLSVDVCNHVPVQLFPFPLQSPQLTCSSGGDCCLCAYKQTLCQRPWQSDSVPSLVHFTNHVTVHVYKERKPKSYPRRFRVKELREQLTAHAGSSRAGKSPCRTNCPEENIPKDPCGSTGF